MSHRRRMDSCDTIGPMERTCSTSTCAKRSDAACSAAPSWLEMMADERTMSSNTVVHQASCTSPRTCSTLTRRALRSATSSFSPAEANSCSSRQRSGKVSSALRSSSSAFRRASTFSKSAVSRLPPAGVVESTVSSAVILLTSASWVEMISSSLLGSTGQPP